MLEEMDVIFDDLSNIWAFRESAVKDDLGLDQRPGSLAGKKI